MIRSSIAVFLIFSIFTIHGQALVINEVVADKISSIKVAHQDYVSLLSAFEVCFDVYVEKLMSRASCDTLFVAASPL